MTISTVVAPAVLPMASTDAVLLEHLSLSAPGQSRLDMIDAFIAAATGYIETYIRQRLITQTVELRLDAFPSGAIALPIGPVQSVEGATYTAPDGTEATIEPEDFRLLKSGVPNCLAPVYGATWPIARDEQDSVKVQMVVGFGSAGADVPASIMQALRLLVAHMFDNREAVNVGNIVTEMPFGVAMMLAPHRLWI